ncbi:MAG: MerR family transcriptional regulator [Clostridium sp.]|jgi:DNA-binding transcriptional MerR regulator|nr:MerR family transcriptional regulator [Clostridium sp.]
MSQILLISDAAKEVHVESHVLRYWEEELRLPIKRNELGHRYYTKEDVERFKQIKGMKERGLQLKAIKMILKDGKLDVLMTNAQTPSVVNHAPDENEGNVATSMIAASNAQIQTESREEKARRLQWLLQQMIRETIQENNKELSREIKEAVVKEMDYQFRQLEERQEEHAKLSDARSEAYYKRMDELLRKKSRRGSAVESPGTASPTETESGSLFFKKEKRKRRSSI